MARSAEKPAAAAIDHSRFGYARVSTRGQTLEVQHAALTAGIAPARVLAEKKSGKVGSPRPQWQDVRSRLRPGDTLTVTRLDRMGRDMREILETAWSLQDLGARIAAERRVHIFKIGSQPVSHVFRSHPLEARAVLRLGRYR
jgi:hypothetical protein